MALVQYNGQNVLTCGLARGGWVRFLPGINECDANDLEAILKVPVVAWRVEQGIIKVLDDGKSQGKKSVEEMIAMIPKIVDKKLLNKITKTDGRPAVIEAAKNQLSLIEVKVEDKAKDQDDGPMHFN